MYYRYRADPIRLTDPTRLSNRVCNSRIISTDLYNYLIRAVNK